MTKREQILQAVAAALAGTTGVGTRIYRSRTDPVSRAESPALIVQPFRDVPEEKTSLPSTDHKLLVRVLVIVRAAVPDQAADPIIESLHARLMTDPALGALIMGIKEAPTDFEAEPADLPSGTIQCLYQVEYRTRANDLTQGP